MYEQNGYHFLEVGDLTAQDKGRVTCRVRNSAGSVSVDAELDVFGECAVCMDWGGPWWGLCGLGCDLLCLTLKSQHIKSFTI